MTQALILQWSISTEMGQAIRTHLRDRHDDRGGLRQDRVVRRKQGGFTIVELTIVLVLLSMTASIGIPAYFSRPTITLDNAAKLLAKDLREIQNRAARYQEQLEIRFPKDGSGYAATDRMGEPLISPYGVGDFRRHYPIDAIFRGVTIKKVRAGGDRAISFSPEGRPLESAEVVIEFRGEQRTVMIRGRSGLLAIDGLNEPWIDLGD